MLQDCVCELYPLFIEGTVIMIPPSVHLTDSDFTLGSLSGQQSTSEFHDCPLSEQGFAQTKIDNLIFLTHKHAREPTRILSASGKVKTRC